MLLRSNIRFHSTVVFITTIAAFFLLSCNNAAESAAGKDSANNTAVQPIPLSTDSAARVDDFSFIDGCVETNKTKMDESKAFAHCKCIMAQIKLKFGNTDSLTIANLQKDTAEIRRILNACK